MISLGRIEENLLHTCTRDNNWGSFADAQSITQYNIPMKHYTLPIIIERDAEGFYVSCPPLQGCYSQGDTNGEALSNVKDAIRLHLEDRQADHDELIPTT